MFRLTGQKNMKWWSRRSKKSAQCTKVRNMTLIRYSPLNQKFPPWLSRHQELPLDWTRAPILKIPQHHQGVIGYLATMSVDRKKMLKRNIMVLWSLIPQHINICRSIGSNHTCLWLGSLLVVCPGKIASAEFTVALLSVWSAPWHAIEGLKRSWRNRRAAQF